MQKYTDTNPRKRKKTKNKKYKIGTINIMEMTRKAIPCSIYDASLREPSDFYFLANVFLVLGYSAHR